MAEQYDDHSPGQHTGTGKFALNTGRLATMKEVQEPAHEPNSGSDALGTMKRPATSSRTSSSRIDSSTKEKASSGKGYALLLSRFSNLPIVKRTLPGISERIDAVVSQNSLGIWRTSFFRLGPLSGIFAMIVALLALVASLGVLTGSNGQPADDWKASPAVL